MQSILALTLTHGQESQKKVLERSIAEASPTALLVWASTARTESISDVDNVPPGVHQMMAVGCEDGSIYILDENPLKRRRRYSSNGARPTTTDRTNYLHTTKPPQYLGVTKRPPRSSSPSSTKSSIPSPLQLSKSRVVSGVSTEQVEAPKNYVDFDDEPERLKGMLKGKDTKDKSPKTLSPSDAMQQRGERSDSLRMLMARLPTSTLDDSGTVLSTRSPSSTHSISSPPSPSTFPDTTSSDDTNTCWSLSFHIFPPWGHPGQIVSLVYSAQIGLILCLHQRGGLVAYSTKDGSCATSVVPDQSHRTAEAKHAPPPSLWSWKSLYCSEINGVHIVLATAMAEISSIAVQSADAHTSNNEEQTRLVAYELRKLHAFDSQTVSLVPVGDWSLDTTPEALDCRTSASEGLEVFYVSATQHIIRRQGSLKSTQLSPSEPMNTSSSAHLPLPLPNPFKALASRSTEHVIEELLAEKKDSPDLVLHGENTDLGTLALGDRISGLRISSCQGGVRGVVWTQSELAGFDYSQRTLKKHFSSQVQGVVDVRWISDVRYVVMFDTRLEIHEFGNVHSSSDEVLLKSNHLGPQNTQSSLESFTITSFETAFFTSSGQLFTTVAQNDSPQIAKRDLITQAPATGAQIVWKTSVPNSFQTSEPSVTAILPSSLTSLVLGLSNGFVSQTSFLNIASWKIHSPTSLTSDIALPGAILGLHLIQNVRTGEELLVGGSDDGSVGVWSFGTFKLLAKWTIFTVPLAQVINLHEGRLRGCALCISKDGTIAVIGIDGFQLLFIIPAAVALLTRIYLKEDNLLLDYEDNRARLWDITTREFWRSMSAEKADELVKADGWLQWSIDTLTGTKDGLSTISRSMQAADGAATLLIDTETLLAHLTSSGSQSAVAPSSVHDKAPGSVTERIEFIRSLLSIILIPGLNADIDRICREELRISMANLPTGCVSQRSTIIFNQLSAHEVWTISPYVSATRALAIVATLEALSHHQGISDNIDTVRTFYTTGIGPIVGDEFQSPDLPFLARQWIKSSSHWRTASRQLFEAGIAQLSDEDATSTSDLWQKNLPCMLSDPERESVGCAMALFICGSIAVDRYTLLSTNCLTDIAKSVSMYLDNESSQYRSLAIDLCSRGFPIWQQHVDAVQMLRSLFTLATTSKKETISVQNVGQQARTAILHIASSNTPLFVTTLSMDILHPQNLQHRKSVLQLVIFLIRKKPLVLYSNLPRLVEAVVKSLDPNSTTNRDAVLDSATEILGHIVQSFPTVDFHMGSQRLVVGTSEGAVVMYDLKTATRLYVLEGHKKRTTACSFSPDGRRLVTVSLEECAVLVWKVGSSFSSFFNPGAPPRQGHGGSEPFKTLNFNIGDEVNMSLASTLELVKFEWTADRSVKLNIRDSVFTFST